MPAHSDVESRGEANGLPLLFANLAKSHGYLIAKPGGCVEAETVEEARELLAAGAGYRCQIGECINIEVDSVED